jgi:hypothetical protein
MELKLAEALLRRKELSEKVKSVEAFKAADLYEVKVKRTKVTDDIDDIIASVPKLTFSQVVAERDFYARQLRLIDGAIQQANWTTAIEVNDTVTQDFKA